jgi:hypothetical protein
MRPRFLFMMLLIIAGSSAASAQQEPVMTHSQLNPFQKIAPVKLSVRRITDTTIPKRALINNKYIKDWYYEGVLLDSSSLGKVYSMPVDNMLCLVPDATKTACMPVKKIKAPEQMPNAFSRRGMNNAGKK